MSRPNKRYYKKPITTTAKTQKNDVRDRILKAFETRYEKCDQTHNVISPVSSLSLRSRTRHKSTAKEKPKDLFMSFMGNTNKRKEKRNIKRRVYDTTSSDEKNEVKIITPELDVVGTEDIQPVRRKKRKTRAERNNKAGRSKTSSNKSENRSNVAKHITTTQTLTNAGEHSKENDTSLSKISNTRLTKRLGLFSHGKKSAVIGREPILVTDSIRKKTEDDIWKIIHSDKEDDTPTKMDIDEIISPKDEVLPLPQSKPTKSLSSIELLVPPRPSHKTPLSHQSSVISIHQQTHSVKSTTTTGISTGCSTVPPATHSDDNIQKSPPLKEVYNLVMNSIRKKNTVSKKEYVQEMCDDLKKLMKQNTSVIATPMSTRITSRTSAFTNNSSVQRSLLQSLLPNKSADENNISSRSEKYSHKHKNQSDNNKSKDIEMITCSQSSLPTHKSAFIDAKLLLEHNDIMELSRPRESNNPEMMETGSLGDGSRPMSLSQSSGFHSVHSASTPIIEQLIRDSQHNIHDHRQNLLTAIERASRPSGTIRSTGAVITELHPQFMPGFHGEFYKDTIEKRDPIWNETNYNSQHPQPQKRGLDILDFLDTSKKSHQNQPHNEQNHSSHYPQLHYHSGHCHQLDCLSGHHFKLHSQLDHHHSSQHYLLDHHHSNHYNQLDHHSSHQYQLDHHLCPDHHHSSHHADYHHHHANHTYIPPLPTSPILDSWNFPPQSSPTSPPKLFPQRLY